jgi:N6-L-threonylcarbamoyladenine synthase
MKILAIDTSCDETAAAVTQGTTVLSNVIWSQASLHAKFGGVMPSLAQRMHRERIDFVVERAISKSQIPISKLDAIAVTAGPGLAIALEVGIAKAKELAKQLKIPLVPVNHIEGHLLSPMAKPSHLTPSPLLNSGEGKLKEVRFPALGLVVSGGHTELILIKKIGKYEILAKTQDDALGEALDKVARMLGLGYPGGAILEKMARLGNPKAYPLPLPMARSEERNSFSYSGLKTAFYRLVNSLSQSSSLSKQQVYDLAAALQNRAFEHLIRVCRNTILSLNTPPWPSPNLGEGIKGRSIDLLVGGGVAANIELRKRLRKMGRELGLRVRLPYSAKLVGDNAAMIGIAAGLRIINHCSLNITHYEDVDRQPRWSIDQDFSRV